MILPHNLGFGGGIGGGGLPSICPMSGAPLGNYFESLIDSFS